MIRRSDVSVPDVAKSFIQQKVRASEIRQFIESMESGWLSSRSKNEIKSFSFGLLPYPGRDMKKILPVALWSQQAGAVRLDSAFCCQRERSNSASATPPWA